ncbi:MAG TPA: biotin/lipoyl-binding protein, partial [Planctomycetaceae bacterium]|nr:biotin/lipoyl-binding protein [Planctomycetaceae bacterium]
RYLERQRGDQIQPARTQLSEQFEEFLLQLHRSLNAKEVAAVAANDGRLLINCDRLSVAVQYGKKTVVRAISGQDSVNQRSNLVRRMTAMANKVIQMREPLIYTGKLDHLPTQIEEPLADYIQESGSRMVMVWPLFETEPLLEEDEDESTGRRKEKERKPIGGLIVEQISHSEPRPGLVENVELVAGHVAEALTNARTYERLFLLPVWRFLGRCFRWLEGRNWLKALGVLLLFLAAILSMIFVPATYRVTAEGKLMPVIQRDVFAPWDGEVVEIFVKSGQRVEKGDPLLQLRNDDLRAELVAARNERDEKQELLVALMAELDEAVKTAQREDEIRLQGQIVETRIEMEAAAEQVKILEEREKRL